MYNVLAAASLVRPLPLGSGPRRRQSAANLPADIRNCDCALRLQGQPGQMTLPELLSTWRQRFEDLKYLEWHCHDLLAQCVSLGLWKCLHAVAISHRLRRRYLLLGECPSQYDVACFCSANFNPFTELPMMLSSESEAWWPVALCSSLRTTFC